MKKTLLAAGAVAGLSAVMLTGAAIAQHGPGHHPHMKFEKHDLDGDGNVSRAEVETKHQQRFATADANGDGAVSFDEYVAAAEAEQAARLAERRKKHFEALDADGDGQVSAAEHAAKGSDRHEKMFEKLDTDADGIITAAEREAARSKWAGKKGKGRWGGQD